MRVLYFSRDYTPHDHRFLTALQNLTYEVFYLQLEQRKLRLEDRPLPDQVTKVSWGADRNRIRLRDGFRLIVSLKKVIDQVKPDVVHAGPIQTCALLTVLTGFKNLVSVSWGYDLLQDVNNGRMWRWATQYTLKRSASLIADCETVRRAAVALGMDPERIVVFPWGVDLDRFKPDHTIKRNMNQSFTLLSTRSWEPIYGVEIIAQAFVESAQRHPNLRMIMTGNGSLAGELRRILQRGGVLDRVTFPGHVSQNAMPKFIQSADLYLSASHVDGASISLLEALACGCPVLVSDIPGNLEWIEDGVQGWVFPDGNSRQLSEAIDRAIEMRANLKSMGEKGRALAEARANWALNYPKLKVAYGMAVLQ